MTSSPAIGVIGGSGLYDLEGIGSVETVEVETPFGDPSSPLIEGMLGGRRVIFLSRHGKGHRIAPHEINHRANIWALKSRGVRWLISVAAVGSLREELPPRHAVIPDQFFDRLGGRERHTFFGGGIVAHVSMADPTSEILRGHLASACRELGIPHTNGGTYICMEGPAFSTRAESFAYRQIGGSIIGMTNLPEAKLAREAEIAMATLGMVTDYDCWRTDEAAVTVGSLMDHLAANVIASRRILEHAIPAIPLDADDPAHHALDHALITARECWPPETLKNLSGILDRFV